MQYINKNLLLVLVVAFIIFLLTVIFSINKPFTLDEAMPFAWNAHTINQTGVSALGQRVAEGSNETVLEIAHPPLYNLMLALAFDIFGETNACGRMLGVLSLIFTTGILLKIAQQVYPPEKAWNIGLIAAAIIAINPYFVQYAMLVDIDTSILTLFMTGTIFFFIKSLQTQGNRYTIITGLALGASFWAKEMTPPILIGSIFFFLWFRKGFKQAFWRTLIISVIGVGSFWLTWWGFCEMTNVPIMSFVEFTVLRKGLQARPFLHKLAPFIVLRAMMLWLSLPLFILFVFCLVWRLKNVASSKLFKPLDFLLIYVCSMFMYTMIYIPSSTGLEGLKYAYPMAPILVLAVSAYINEIFGRIRLKHIVMLFAALFSMLAFYLACRLDDPLILLYSNELQALRKAGILFVSPLVLSKIAFKLIRPSTPWARSLAYASLLTLMPMNIYLATKQIFDYTTSLSWDNYGERGFSQTVEYLANHLRPEDKVILRKDMGYYLNMRLNFAKLQWFYPIFRGETDAMKAEFDQINYSHQLSFIVLEKYSNPSIAAELIQPYFNLDKKIGDFLIYRRKE